MVFQGPERPKNDLKSSLEAKLDQLGRPWNNKWQHWPEVGSSKPQVGANLGPTSAKLGSTWESEELQLGNRRPKRSGGEG